MKSIDVLYDVVTLQEAAVMWDKWPKTVQLQIDVGHLQARKSKGTWLVRYDDLLRLWGKPVAWFLDCE